MRLIIFADNDGCARSIRGNCIQPVMGGGIGYDAGEREKQRHLYGGAGGVVCVSSF